MRELETFRPLARAIAADWSFPGADRDDVEQEAMIGVWQALRSWDPEGGCSLKTWVRYAVRARLASALKQARRLKHGPVSDATREFDQLPSLLDVVDLVEARRRLRHVLEYPLPPREREAVTCLLRGETIHHAGGALEQALVRARRRLKEAA